MFPRAKELLSEEELLELGSEMEDVSADGHGVDKNMRRRRLDRMFGNFANAAARAAGTPAAFLICVTAVLIWGILGPFFEYSEEWQLIINTGTTIVTFLMVFLIQNTQNRDGAALQTKLDELIRSSDAGDEFIGIEKLTDGELEVLQAKCEKAAQLSHKWHCNGHRPNAKRAGADQNGAVRLPATATVCSSPWETGRPAAGGTREQILSAYVRVKLGGTRIGTYLTICTSSQIRSANTGIHCHFMSGPTNEYAQY